MPDVGTTALFYAARPKISVDGEDDAALAQGLTSLSVEEDSEGLFHCEATFGNWGTSQGEVGYLYFARDVLDFGRELAVEMGAGEANRTVFEGVVTALEGRFPAASPPEIAVLAEDRLQDLRMTRRTRSFEDVSLADVAQRIASDHGLSAQVDADGPTYRVLAQVNQSDLAFLRDRARAVDAEIWLESGALHVVARSRRDAGEVTLTYGQGLYECQVLADLAEQRTKVVVGGWDVGAKSGLAGTAEQAAIENEIDGSGGAALLSQALGDRTEQLVHLAPRSDEEARTLAEAHFRQRARRFVTAHAIGEGDGRIRVGASVNLLGLGALFDGRYYVRRVRHEFSAEHGYRTRSELERPWMGS